MTEVMYYYFCKNRSAAWRTNRTRQQCRGQNRGLSYCFCVVLIFFKMRINLKTSKETIGHCRFFEYTQRVHHHGRREALSDIPWIHSTPSVFCLLKTCSGIQIALTEYKRKRYSIILFVAVEYQAKHWHTFTFTVSVLALHPSSSGRSIAVIMRNICIARHKTALRNNLSSQKLTD